jgi:hypothetical protein
MGKNRNNQGCLQNANAYYPMNQFCFALGNTPINFNNIFLEFSAQHFNISLYISAERFNIPAQILFVVVHVPLGR